MLNDYQIEQAAKAAQMNTLVKAIAAALAKLIGGKAVAGLSENDYNRISLEGGRSIYVGKEYNRPRLNISGCWPRNAKGEMFNPSGRDMAPEGLPAYGSISVSMERGADAIAKDIARRFLPGYLAVYTRQLVRANGSDTYANNTRLSLRVASSVLGLPDCKPDAKEFSLYGYGEGDCWGSVEASGESLTISLKSLTQAQALVVLRAIKSFKKG